MDKTKAHLKSEQVEEVYEFSLCTIAIGIQLLPDDGSSDRPVLIGVRNHQDPPLLKMLRSSELGELPPAIVQLLIELEADMPARKAAWEQRQQEKAKVLLNQQNPSKTASSIPAKTANEKLPKVDITSHRNQEKESAQANNNYAQINLFDTF